MGEVGGPEEFVRTDKVYDVAKGFFVRITGNPALPLKSNNSAFL